MTHNEYARYAGGRISDRAILVVLAPAALRHLSRPELFTATATVANGRRRSPVDGDDRGSCDVAIYDDSLDTVGR
jgi:hypothetical protein